MKCKGCRHVLTLWDKNHNPVAFRNEMHGHCYRSAIVLTAAKNWYLAEQDLRAHHHSREDNGGDFQYVPENLATNRMQAEIDLFESVKAMQGGTEVP